MSLNNLIRAALEKKKNEALEKEENEKQVL